MAVIYAKEKPFLFSGLISLHKSWFMHRAHSQLHTSIAASALRRCRAANFMALITV
jgi:hypothetical protein